MQEQNSLLNNNQFASKKTAKVKAISDIDIFKDMFCGDFIPSRIKTEYATGVQANRHLYKSFNTIENTTDFKLHLLPTKTIYIRPYEVSNKIMIGEPASQYPVLVL